MFRPGSGRTLESYTTFQQCPWYSGAQYPSVAVWIGLRPGEPCSIAMPVIPGVTARTARGDCVRSTLAADPHRPPTRTSRGPTDVDPRTTEPPSAGHRARATERGPPSAGHRARLPRPPSRSPGRRRQSPGRMASQAMKAPMTITATPATAQNRSPVMKLPGIDPRPWPTQTGADDGEHHRRRPAAVETPGGPRWHPTGVSEQPPRPSSSRHRSGRVTMKPAAAERLSKDPASPRTNDSSPARPDRPSCRRTPGGSCGSCPSSSTGSTPWPRSARRSRSSARPGWPRARRSTSRRARSGGASPGTAGPSSPAAVPG